MNRLIYYPTGSYGTFVQWLCNTPAISGSEDLPFHTDGNSHRYVLSDQYRLLMSQQCEEDFVNQPTNFVVSCIWPVDHNGRIFNQNNVPDFYFKLSHQHLEYFDRPDIKILVIYPTDTSKIWWYHNNCKKVFYTHAMYTKKVQNQHKNPAWLTCPDVAQRACIQMSHYRSRVWLQALLDSFKCDNINELSTGQLRQLLAVARHEEMADYLSHWQRLPSCFPNIKFVSLDQLRDCTKDTVLDIFEYFNVSSNLPLDFVIDQWTALQTTRHRDHKHADIINCIVNGQPCDWSDLHFDLFDEVYLYHELKYQHNIILNADSIDCLPTNTHDLLLLR